LVLPPAGGSAVLFDTRAVPHQVLPLEPGPPRWSLVLWLQDGRSPMAAGPRLPTPELTLTDALQSLPDPPLPPEVLLVHELVDDPPGGRIVVRRKSAARPRVGLVATVYRGGSGLDAWCDHHFGLGLDHAVLVFDHLEEPAEAADAERLRALYPAERLTLWSGREVQAARWPALPPFPERDSLRAWAEAGAASFAHASRQALNASAALGAARTGELGGAPLDWLLHLDADEWFELAGDGRGGASLYDHFAAAAAGRALVRYLNHELLLPWQAGSPPRFKVNPRLALARHGPAGWQALVAALRMAPTDPRPWFLGYHNGKSAVAVAHGLAAAGVHGWYLDGASQAEELVAGPAILHFHRPTPEAFRRKYQAVAAAPWEGRPPFPPSPAEEAAVALLRSLTDPAAIDRELAALYRRLTTFTPAEVAVLEEAGLLFTPSGPQRGVSSPVGRRA
ncbi:MAG TPA: 2OG-Fe(II) oxygenase, partial [Candidatus Dormibacteraeota bacterium]